MGDAVVVLPAAEADLRTAFVWYEAQRVGLGDRFLACVEECLIAIRRTPEGYRAVRGEYRRALVRRFSYSVYYKFDGTTVIVHAVLHNAQDSRRWQSRLP